jgi:phosphoglycerate dehydrogenase-like enzyme
VVLIGTGEIGAAVARVTKQLGMHVIGVRRRPGEGSLPAGIDEAVSYEHLREVIGRGDFVVASLPLTGKTHRMLGEGVFRAMKRSAVFVNVGRGKTVDEGALARALQAGWIRGAALDVYEQEPLPAESSLWDAPNVLVSPHMGSDTPRYMERMTELLCDNLRRYAAGERLRNVVDPVERY